MNHEAPGRVALAALEALGKLHAISYYEDAVAAYIAGFCADRGLDVEADAYGNVLARLQGGGRDLPPVVFVAHMDHPGYEAYRSPDGAIHGRMMGGLPDAAMESGVQVQFVWPGGGRTPAAVAGRVQGSDGRTVAFEAGIDPLPELPCAVVLDLPDFQIDGDLIRMRALDDLAGCAATLAALAWAAERRRPRAVYGLFTRAEEAGLIGARLAAEDGLLPEGAVVVSVESSHALPGASIGDGPVIRCGDRLTTFDQSAEALLRDAAARIKRRQEGFKTQRQLMSGGVCEASAFAAFGYPVTGLAFPLGNYHNGLYQGIVAAEYIHVDDFTGGARLLAELAAPSDAETPPTPADRLRKRPLDQARRLLRRTQPPATDR